MIDPSGVTGSALHYGLIIAFGSSAFLIFVHLWRSNKLSMDEEPKWIMMQEDQDDRQERK